MLLQQSSDRHLQLWLDPVGGCPLLERAAKRGRPSKSGLAARATEIKVAGSLTHCLICSEDAAIKDSKGASNTSTANSRAPSLWVFAPSTPSSLKGSAHLASLAGTHWQLLKDNGDAAAAGSSAAVATTTNSHTASKASSQLPDLAGTSWNKAQQHGFAGQCKDIVGHSIKVWWPADKAFYSGIVTDYYFSSSDTERNTDDGTNSPSSSSSGANGTAAAAELSCQQSTAAVGSKRKASTSVKDAMNLQGKHRVQYEDGEVELLDLTAETWQLTDYELHQLATQQHRAAGHSSSGMDAAPLPAAGHKLCSFAPDRPTDNLILQPPAAKAAAGGANAAKAKTEKLVALSSSKKGSTDSSGETLPKRQHRTAADAAAAARGTTETWAQLPSPVDALHKAVMGMRAASPPTAATAAAIAANTAGTGCTTRTVSSSAVLPVLRTTSAAAAAADSQTPSPTRSMAAAPSVPSSSTSSLQQPSTGAAAAALATTKRATPSPVLNVAHQTPLQQLLKQGMLAGLRAMMTGGGSSSSTAAAAAASTSASISSSHAVQQSIQAATAAAVAAMAASANKAAAAAQSATGAVAQSPTQQVPPRPLTAGAATPATDTAAAAAHKHSSSSSSRPPACLKPATAMKASPKAGLAPHLAATAAVPPLPAAAAAVPPPAAAARSASVKAGVSSTLIFSPAKSGAHATPGAPAATPLNNSAAAADTPTVLQQQEDADHTELEASGAIMSASFSLDADGAAAILNSSSTSSPAAASDSKVSNAACFKVPAVPGCSYSHLPHPLSLGITASKHVQCGRPASGSARPPLPRRASPSQPVLTAAPAGAAAAEQPCTRPAQGCWQEVPLLESDLNQKLSSTVASTADKTPAAAAATAEAVCVSSSARQLLDEMLAQLEPATTVPSNTKHNSSAVSRRQLQAIIATDNMQFSLLLETAPSKEMRSTRSRSSSSGSSGSAHPWPAKGGKSMCVCCSCIAVLLVRLPAGVQPGSMRVQTSSTALQLSYSQHSSSEAVMQCREVVCLPAGMRWIASVCETTAAAGSTRSSKQDAGGAVPVLKASASKDQGCGSKGGACSPHSLDCNSSKDQTAIRQDTSGPGGAKARVGSECQGRSDAVEAQAVALLQVSSCGGGSRLMVLGRCCST